MHYSRALSIIIYVISGACVVLLGLRSSDNFVSLKSESLYLSVPYVTVPSIEVDTEKQARNIDQFLASKLKKRALLRIETKKAFQPNIPHQNAISMPQITSSTILRSDSQHQPAAHSSTHNRGNGLHSWKDGFSDMERAKVNKYFSTLCISLRLILGLVVFHRKR